MSTARQLAALGRRYVESKASAYTVLPADVGKTILVTGTWTLFLPLVAVAQNGFVLSLRNTGTGIITIDPAGAETVNGLAAIGLYPSDSVELVCDGVAWHAFFQSTQSTVKTETLAVARATIDLVLPSEFRWFELEYDGVEPSVEAALGLRFSNDGGTAFFATSGNYAWAASYDNASNPNSTSYDSASGSIFLSTGFELTPGVQTAVIGRSNAGRVTISPRANGRHGSARWEAQPYAAFYRGGGYLGISTGDISALRLVYNTGNIAAGARYTLIGHR